MGLFIAMLQYIGAINKRKEEEKHRMEKESFKSRFRELYDLSGCPSITQFAKQLDMNRQSVDRYYNGERCPDAPALAQICEKMNVSADWLLGLSDIRTSSADTRAVCEYTGLSEEAINSIKSNGIFHMPVDALSHLIASSDFINLITSYASFLDLLGKMTNLDLMYGPFTTYRQRADGKVVMSCEDAVYHYMNKASMALTSICQNTFDETIKEKGLKPRDYDEEDLNAEIKATEEEISYLKGEIEYIKDEILRQADPFSGYSEPCWEQEPGPEQNSKKE